MSYTAAYHPRLIASKNEGPNYIEAYEEDEKSTVYDLDYSQQQEFSSQLHEKEIPFQESNMMPLNYDRDENQSYRSAPYNLTKIKLLRFVYRFFEMAKYLYFQQRRRALSGEGASLLRFFCFVGGLGMFFSSIFSIINIFNLLTTPSIYILQLYESFFGVTTMIVEAKDWECVDQFKPWIHEWFRFLTVPAGKGAFYIFIGSLGVSLWTRNILLFAFGIYMSFMGLAYLAIHTNTNSSQPYYNTTEQGQEQTAILSMMMEGANESTTADDVEADDNFYRNMHPAHEANIRTRASKGLC